MHHSYGVAETSLVQLECIAGPTELADSFPVLSNLVGSRPASTVGICVVCCLPLGRKVVSYFACWKRRPWGEGIHKRSAVDKGGHMMQEETMHVNKAGRSLYSTHAYFRRRVSCSCSAPTRHHSSAQSALARSPCYR
jgi:hypothetical protein